MRIAVLHPQAAFVRGGAEAHAQALVRALQEAGHEADLVTIAWQWFPPARLAHNMAIWRSFDISESNGLKVDAVIALKFPAYLVHHERKIVWLSTSTGPPMTSGTIPSSPTCPVSPKGPRSAT